MPLHRLTIRRAGRMLGHFDSDTPWAAQAVQEVAARLRASDGFTLAYEVAQDERRVVESGPHGVRVLSVEYLFAPAVLPA